ncbi:AMP-binding protein [bacterium]|nr:AMP-binding protein [bacterium]
MDHKDQEVPSGEVGEIVCRGQAVLKEYYKNTEATREAMKNGWFHTGDLARKDEDGFLYLVDRKKDMIISGGENIYSAEIEKILNNHPKIDEVAVIGVPCEKFGESVHAVIVPINRCDISLDEISDYCARFMAGYKKPRSIQIVDALPRNAGGKVLKTKLRENTDRKI